MLHQNLIQHISPALADAVQGGGQARRFRDAGPLRRGPLRTGLAGLGLAGALLLTGCSGSATVEGDPTDAAAASSSGTSVSAATATTSGTSTSRVSAATDGGVQPSRVAKPDETPSPARSEDDKRFLTALGNNDIDTVGAEDVAIGTATEICRAVTSNRDPQIVANATAGQWSAQGRSKLQAEQLAPIILEATQRIYGCS